MENNKNKNLWIGGAVFLIIILGLVFWSVNKNDPSSSTDDLNGQPSIEDTSTGSINLGASPSSYTDALAKYYGARLELDADCKANPNKFIFKNGGYLMIDNRAPNDRVVTVGTPFNIKAYGFKIIKLEAPAVPATWSVDCDQSLNVASISLE